MCVYVCVVRSCVWVNFNLQTHSEHFDLECCVFYNYKYVSCFNTPNIYTHARTLIHLLTSKCTHSMTKANLLPTTMFIPLLLVSFFLLNTHRCMEYGFRCYSLLNVYGCDPSVCMCQTHTLFLSSLLLCFALCFAFHSFFLSCLSPWMYT